MGEIRNAADLVTDTGADIVLGQDRRLTAGSPEVQNLSLFASLLVNSAASSCGGIMIHGGALWCRSACRATVDRCGKGVCLSSLPPLLRSVRPFAALVAVWQRAMFCYTFLSPFFSELLCALGSLEWPVRSLACPAAQFHSVVRGIVQCGPGGTPS